MDRVSLNQRGGLLVVVLAVLLVVGLLGWSVVQNYTTAAILTQQVDQRRQQWIEVNVMNELIREAMYDIESEDKDVLKNKIHDYMSDYFRVPVQVDISGNVTPPVIGPLAWSSATAWPVTPAERESLPLSILRWTGVGLDFYRGETLDIRVVAEKEFRFQVTPFYIPVSCLPYVSYDLSWEGFDSPSVVRRTFAYRLPIGWQPIAGHPWSSQVPSRLRDLLQLRMGLYRQWLDSQHESQWMRTFAEQATVLNFNEPTALAQLESVPGITLSDEVIQVDLNEFSGDTLLVEGAGEVRFVGFRSMQPLVVLAVPADTGMLQLTVADTPYGAVGPLVLYGMTAWRSENAGELYITTADGTSIVGACILSPGIWIDVQVRGHISMHTPENIRYSEDFEIMVIPWSPQEINSVGHWVPILTVWQIVNEW